MTCIRLVTITTSFAGVIECVLNLGEVRGKGEGQGGGGGHYLGGPSAESALIHDRMLVLVCAGVPSKRPFCLFKCLCIVRLQVSAGQLLPKALPQPALGYLPH